MTEFTIPDYYHWGVRVPGPHQATHYGSPTYSDISALTYRVVALETARLTGDATADQRLKALEASEQATHERLKALENAPALTNYTISSRLTDLEKRLDATSSYDNLTERVDNLVLRLEGASRRMDAIVRKQEEYRSESKEEWASLLKLHHDGMDRVDITDDRVSDVAERVDTLFNRTEGLFKSVDSLIDATRSINETIASMQRREEAEKKPATLRPLTQAEASEQEGLEPPLSVTDIVEHILRLSTPIEDLARIASYAAFEIEDRMNGNV